LSPWKKLPLWVALAAVMSLAGCELWPADTNPFTTVQPSTDFGHAIQAIYEQVTWIVMIILVLVFALLGYVLVRFRDDGSPGNPKQIHGNAALEFGWTLAPVFIVIMITVPTIRTIFEIGGQAPEGAVEVRVTGKRWWWAFEYLESGVVTANELHLPVGKPVSLLLESDTVIHSFWVPRLGGKRDLVPGRVNRMWFTIQDEVAKGAPPIEYLGECAEFCGEQHARMRKRVYAHHPDDFDAWLVDMKTPVEITDPKALAGKEIFTGNGGCAGCHTVKGEPAATGKTGPSLTRYADRHSIGAGAYLFDGKTPEEIHDALVVWVQDPDAIKRGSTKDANHSRGVDGMNIPDRNNDQKMGHEFTEEEADQLVAYLLALKTSK